MHPLHDHIASQLAEKLKSRTIVVWYDERREFAPFVAELRRDAPPGERVARVTVGDLPALLAEYVDSYLELRTVVEPHFEDEPPGRTPETMLIYVPGRERDYRGSMLMELEKTGTCYERSLKQLARAVLRTRFTDGVIDDMLKSEHVTYEDIRRLAEGTSGPAKRPSLLKAIFHDVPGDPVAAWLASDARDGQIAAKEATGELAKLIRSRLGLEVDEHEALPKLRAITVRYVLAGEFRMDLRCPPPSSLESVPAPKTKAHEKAVGELAQALRASFPAEYPALADQVQSELALATAKLDPAALGSVDTFRFEERAILEHCGELIASQRFDEAMKLATERNRSFWVDRDLARTGQWEAIRRMAELGRIATIVRGETAKAGPDAATWVATYAADDGWFRMDRAQRRLESLVASLSDEPDEKPLRVVRRLYEDTCHAMAQGFSKALEAAKWCLPGLLHQTRVFSEVVDHRPKPVAYFLVDAMRYEMGVELAERLPRTAEIERRYALAALPTITPVGMAALQPGASGSFSVGERNGKLGVQIDGAFLSDLAARRKFAASRIPKLVDIALDELLSLPQSKLKKKVQAGPIVIVRSQEIDHAGEAGFSFQARQVMDNVIDNIARAIVKLSKAGIEHSVVSADHGHLFYADDLDESMRIDKPGGNEIELHRRCWIGRGGTTPPGCVRVTAAALGYDSDLDVVFPRGGGVFKAGGDLAYHHGGPSLQELVLPVLGVRLKTESEAAPSKASIVVTGMPEAITNRIFSVKLELGASLFENVHVVRPLLVASGKRVGAPGVAIGAELDRATGCIALEKGKTVTVAFLLSEDVPALRIVVQDPSTDAELYRSPSDISVKLGV